MARYVFIVQGDGRGHISQAMAMQQMLVRRGHRLDAVYLGTFPSRSIPRYYADFTGDLLRTFPSPGFIHRSDHKGIRVWRSILHTIPAIRKYLKAIRRMKTEIMAMEPDCVINFFDISGSFVLRRLPRSVLKVAISHHFYLMHSDFSMPEGKPVQRLLLRLLNAVTGWGADRLGALSFRPGSGEGKLYVVPPIIREEVQRMTRIPGERDLVYLLHHGFLEEFVRFANADPDYRADIFLDRHPDHPVPPNLSLHLPDAALFLEKMRSCRRLFSTAGFDTIAEAALLRIPVVAVPVRCHFEQLCNAYDMEKAGFGIRAEDFSAGVIRSSLPMNDSSYDAYKRWVDQSETILLKLIEK